MRRFSAICWWALAVVFFTERVESTSSNDVDETNYRLPNETYPEHYNIELTTNVHLGEKAFQGEVTIDIVVENPTSKIVLHYRQLQITKATIANPFTNKTEDLSIEYEQEREFLTLKRRNSEQFLPHKKWKLTIIYSGELHDDDFGFYLSKYKDDDGNYHYVAATIFEQINARHAFPCYDEPNKRANFTITINHSPNYTAISTMPVNGNLSSANRTVFLTTPSMPTYSVGFVVCDFEYTEIIYKNLPQRIYSRPSGKNLREEILPKIPQIMDYVSNYFDVEYMLPKLDHVAIPDCPTGSPENWGVIMYTEIFFLHELITSDFHSKFVNLSFIAHVIIDQWFGHYVSISSWTYTWLKEGLSSFYAFKALNHIYPEWNVWEFYQKLWQNEALNLDSNDPSVLLTNHAQPIKRLEDSDTVDVDPKSTSIMHMWSNALTDKVFQKGLRNFLKKNQYKSVGEQELFNALQSAVKEANYEVPATINEMFSTWSNQRGHPLLTVSRNYSDGTFTIKQETYYTNETIKDSKTWYVPINYAVASNPNFSDTKATHYLRNVTETNFTDAKISNNDWLILNKQSTGYYRVNYDTTNWNLIIESLIENPFVIHNRTRAQLLKDAIAFWESNRLDVSVLFKLFTYFKKEDNYLCWSNFYEYYMKVNSYLMTNRKYNDLKFFFAEQLSPIYEKLRLVNKSSDYYEQKYRRNIINKMASVSDLNICMKDDCNRLKNHLKENKTLTGDVLHCNAMKMSDDEVFNTLYQALIDKENNLSKIELISALSCHRNVDLIKKLIRSSIDKSNNLENDYRYFILKATCFVSHMTFSACVEFLNDNWNAYGNLKTDTEKSNPLNNLILEMASKTFNKHQENQLLALVNNVKNSKHVSPALETDVKNKIGNNLKIAKKSIEQILPWVAEYRRNAMQKASESI